MKNIVVFGPTQSGKTTLLGYLHTLNLSEREFNRQVRKNLDLLSKLSLDCPVDKDMILPSFISMDKDELRKFNTEIISKKGKKYIESSVGSTKRVHRKQVTIYTSDVESINQKCIFIDTPGTRTNIKEDFKGIFEGDIGICVLSIIDIFKFIDHTRESSNNQFNEDELLQEERRLFEPIQFWCMYKSPKRLIIVLSKTDIFDYNQSVIHGAIDVIQNRVREITDVPILIVPTAINISEISDGNSGTFVVNDRNIRLSFGNDSLIAVLKSLFMRCHIVNNCGEIELASIDRIAKIGSSSKLALRVKILIGNLHAKSEFIIGPVLHKREKEIMFLKGSIKSLKNEDHAETTEVLQEGSIGGIAFDFLQEEGSNKKQSLEEFKILKSTVLTKPPYIRGDLLVFRIKLDELNIYAEAAIADILPKEQIDLFWFGKKISLDLIELFYENEFLVISLSPLSRSVLQNINSFIMTEALNNNTINMENFMLSFPEPIEKISRYAPQKNTYVFIGAVLVNITSINSNGIIKVVIEGACNYGAVEITALLGFNAVLDIESENTYSLTFTNVCYENIGNLYKNIRNYMKDNVVYNYTIKFQNIL